MIYNHLTPDEITQLEFQAGKKATEILDELRGKSIDPDLIESAVNDWLGDHPEATTTVQDGSITKAKLNTALQNTVDSIPAVDATLATSGAAADAKKVGDEVSGLKSAIEGLENGFKEIPLEFTLSPNTRFVSQQLSVSAYDFPLIFKCADAAYSFYVSFYYASGSPTNTTWQKTEYVLEESNLPSGTVAVSMTGKADDEHTLTDAEKALFTAGEAWNLANDVKTLKGKIKTVYVSTSGNDGNDGSMASPFKTITKAINSNAGEILVKPGTYSERLNLTNIHGLTIAPWSYGTFAAGDDDKKIILDGINSRPLLMLFENCTDITLVGIKVVNFTASGFRFKDCSGVHLIDCEAGLMYGSYQYGIGFEFVNTNGDVESCYAHDVSLDGFNIHGFGTTRFVNCVATNCGDDGISHHDACVGYISGGEYSGCGKGGIASPTYGAYINVDSAYCHDNLYGIYAVSVDGHRRSKALINNCALKNNTNKDLYVDYADVTGWNNIYDTKTVGSNATLTELS